MSKVTIVRMIPLDENDGAVLSLREYAEKGEIAVGYIAAFICICRDD